jgi:Ser/Thr protein kinase RdoA (MazF antagonist)
VVVSTDETPLAVWGSGAAASKASRRQDVVLHAAGPWSRSVVALLKHLEAVGFEGAPRPVGDGFDADGREAITYIPGTTPHPRAWDDQAVSAIGTLLRQLHEATESFQPAADATWQPSFVRLLPGDHPVIGHGDLGPWNVVAQGGTPVAFIDWEFAGPVDARWELAEAAWLNAQLHDDDIAERAGLPSAAHRGRQVRLLLDAYGLPTAERAGFVDRMIELAVHSARSEAVQYGVTLDTTTAVDASGYPVLWAITWRTRSASWMLRNRQTLERALT